MNPSSSLFRRENTSFQKFASSTLEVTRPSTIDPQWFFFFCQGLWWILFLIVFLQCSMSEEILLWYVGPISSIPQFLHECPRYHSSCQSHSAPAVLADAGDILAHPPAYKINKVHYLTVKPGFRQSLTVLLCVLESLSGMPVTRTALLSYFASASCPKAALTVWLDVRCLTKLASFSEWRDYLGCLIKMSPGGLASERMSCEEDTRTLLEGL